MGAPVTWFAIMKKFSCGDVVPGCTHSFRAATEDDLLSQVAAHAKKDHGLESIPSELVDQVKRNIRDADA